MVEEWIERTCVRSDLAKEREMMKDIEAAASLSGNKELEKYAKNKIREIDELSRKGFKKIITCISKE